MATAQLAPGGQVTLPAAVMSQLRLRDGRPATLLKAEVTTEGVLLTPLEPRDLSVERLERWVAEGEVELSKLREGSG